MYTVDIVQRTLTTTFRGKFMPDTSSLRALALQPQRTEQQGRIHPSLGFCQRAGAETRCKLPGTL